MKCKCGSGQSVTKILIELDAGLLQGEKPKVWGVQADGKKVAFAEAPSVKKAVALKGESEPPKFLDATSITVVRTNPCGWVQIGGKWYYRCW
jgi:hypothetical protein